MKRTIVAVAAAGLLAGADWPSFRGPAGNGIGTDPKLPIEWAADKNVAWKKTVPGAAWSCPIVVGDKVIVTTAITENQRKPSGGFGGGGGGGKGGAGGGGGKGGPPGGGGYGKSKAPDVLYTWKVMAFDKTTGNLLWEQNALESKPKHATHSSNTFASETPVSDGERVYAYFGPNGLYCYDLAGKELWKKDLGSPAMMAGWGTSSSPVVHNGLLFILNDNEEKSFLVALDSKTGDEKWRVDRTEKSGWSTPYIWKQKDRTDLVVGGSQKARGYDPATGKVVWELAIGGGQASASPVGDETMLYYGTGGGGGFGGKGGSPGGGKDAPPMPKAPGGGAGLYAVKAGATGDISLKEGEKANEFVAWNIPLGGSAAASPLAYEGKVYILDRNGGSINCYDAKSGKKEYKERIEGAKAFWASPWAYDGKVFCLDEDGNTHVIKAGATFEVMGKNSLAKELYWATPAIADGALFVRGVDSLYRIAK